MHTSKQYPVVNCIVCVASVTTVRQIIFHSDAVLIFLGEFSFMCTKNSKTIMLYPNALLNQCDFGGIIQQALMCFYLYTYLVL